VEKILRQAGEMVLDLATRKGVAAEAYLLHSRDLNIELRDNQIETLKQAEEMGLGLRVVNKGRIGFAFTSDINPAALTEAVNNAVAISAYTSSDEHNHFPGPGCVYPAIDTFDTVISATPLQDKIDLAREMENTARAIDHRIVQVEKAGYEESEFSCC
jgi:PmbA protein